MRYEAKDPQLQVASSPPQKYKLNHDKKLPRIRTTKIDRVPLCIILYLLYAAGKFQMFSSIAHTQIAAMKWEGSSYLLDRCKQGKLDDALKQP